MKISPEDRKYILENFQKISLHEIAKKLNLKERKIKNFIESHSAKRAVPETAERTAPSRAALVVFAAVFALSFLIYSNTFHSSFHFDDMTEIAQNPYIQKLPQISVIWDRHKTRFVTYLTFAMNYSFGQLNVSGYHFVNILLHALCGFLVYYLAALLLKTPLARDSVLSRNWPLIAFFAGLIFISHPVQTQAVTYIVQRAASLATLFYVLSLIFYLKVR